MKDIDWGKVEITDKVADTFFKDEGEADEKAKLAKDDRGKKVDDKGKGKVDDWGKEKVDDYQNRVSRLEKAKSKLMVSKKGTKKASVDLVDALDLQNRIKKLYEDFNMLVKTPKTKEAKEAKVVKVSSDEKDFSDEGFFDDEDVVLFNVVKYPLTYAEIRMFKERPTTSRAPITSTSTTSRSVVPIASISNAQASSTAPRGYMKIAMTGCAWFKSSQ
ncbi:hypothetical protein Tco_0139062 [Tanacetum coccineum]